MASIDALRDLLLVLDENVLTVMITLMWDEPVARRPETGESGHSHTAVLVCLVPLV